MGGWSKGRVMLIGDAAACVSLLAGEGAGLAITEAYVLAGELNRSGQDYPTAYRRYEQLLRPFVPRAHYLIMRELRAEFELPNYDVPVPRHRESPNEPA
jgi:2-polyprenyl-6-methoxyphenol hydroxylase-like FAD-dependent oxidoreductase